MRAIAGRFGGLRKVALLAAVHFAAIAALVAVAPGVAHAAGSCSTTAGVTTCTFGPTGAEDTFTVPDGVSSIHVVATGASGAVSATSFAAGSGAEVSGDLTVIPGQTLYVEVGGAPTGGGNCFSGVACVGGFNGGGSSRSGGGGGGASDVREQARDQSGSLSSRLIVAAGGGGSGQGTFCRPNMTVFRGGAGGDAGSNGGNGEKCVTVSGGTGGGAGGQTGGGAGGSPDGQSGSLGLGGNGGVNTGGGGGGGLYGGGSGGSLVFGSFGSEPIQAPAGGGGGGSNLVPTGGNATIVDSGPSITISYTGPNQAPVAADDAYSTNEDATLTVDAPDGVLKNDTDANDDALSAAQVSGPSHGSLSLNSNGSFTYMPNANYHGGDSFTYKASDGRGGEDTATVTITVNALNDAPVADNQSVSTNEDTDESITLTATDAENDPLTFSVVDGPTHGTLSGTGANLTYHPAANYDGSDSFTYKANDGSADSNEATVSITVNAVNDAPVASNDSYTTDEDTPLNIAAPGVLANDSDVDGGDTLSAAVVAGPAHGTLTLNANGSFSYTPATNYNGPDSFTYKASDGTADSAPATVSITVDLVNEAPTVTVDRGGACGPASDMRGTINLALSDPDDPPESLRLSATSSNQAVLPDGNISFGGSTDPSRTMTVTRLTGTGASTLTVTAGDGEADGTVKVRVLSGSASDDALSGSALSDMIFAKRGSDAASGRGSKDLLCGGNGRDELTGGLLADHFGGGAGTDTATDFDASQGDTKAGIP